MTKENSEEEATKSFLANIGLAVFQAQALEYSLVTLFAASELLSSKMEARCPKLLRALMDTRYRHTLGMLVGDAVKSLEISSDVAEKLREALEIRNWLVHCFYREFAPAGYNRSLMDAANERLHLVHAKLSDLVDRISGISKSRILATGVSQVDLDKRIGVVTEEYIREKLDTLRSRGGS